MSNIIILGAGSKGTAFSIPCSDRNHKVTIVGTYLENKFIDIQNKLCYSIGFDVNEFT